MPSTGHGPFLIAQDWFEAMVAQRVWKHVRQKQASVVILGCWSANFPAEMRRRVELQHRAICEFVVRVKPAISQANNHYKKDIWVGDTFVDGRGRAHEFGAILVRGIKPVLGTSEAVNADFPGVGPATKTTDL